MTTLRELYEQALQQPLIERGDWLLQACPDAALRSQVQALLAASEDIQASDPLQGFIGYELGRLIADEQSKPADYWLNKTIGAYRITRWIGQGGSAVIFEAERVGVDFKQTVALKLLKRGLHSALDQRLFQREQQTLATLDHPNIARLIDGGIADGMPYLAIECIDGQPITSYCDQHRLDSRQRLQLFAQICRVVDAAHRALIVHRDIKPSNILVTAKGQIKLLDFGIAKLLDDGVEATGTGMMPFTPEYAAPEQFKSEPITTATDVYALGVVLHLLLVGERPDRNNRQRASVHAMQREKINQTTPAKSHYLRGDLDTIIGQATAADVNRRYRSAQDLAQDIESFLADRPISAHPPSVLYQAKKFLRRHRGVLLLSALMLTAILLSLGTAVWQNIEARREAERANAVRDVLIELLSKTTPNRQAVERPDLPTLVAQSADLLPDRLKNQPDVQVELLTVLAGVLRQMKAPQQSMQLLESAKTSIALLHERSKQVIDWKASTIRSLIKLKRYDEAEPYLQQLLAIPEKELPVSTTRASILKLAMIHEIDPDKTIAIGEQMIQAYSENCRRGYNCDDMAFGENDFAANLLGVGQIRRARDLYIRSIDRRRKGNYPYSSLVNSIAPLGGLSVYLGELDEAENYAREALKIKQSLGNSLLVNDDEYLEQLFDVLLAKENVAQAKKVLAMRRADTNLDACYGLRQALDQLKLAIFLNDLVLAKSAVANTDRKLASCQPTMAWYLQSLIKEEAAVLKLRWKIRAGEVLEDTAFGQLIKQQERIQAAHPFTQINLRYQLLQAAVNANKTAIASDQARALLALLDRIEAVNHAPYALEASLVLYQNGDRTIIDIRFGSMKEFENALVSISRWPVGQRLQRQWAALKEDSIK